MPKTQFLSNTSKMPGLSISLDARHCVTGSKLAKIPGTTCHGCYALKGRYRMPNVRAAMARRLDFMRSTDFVPRMVEELRTHEKSGFFRWFDSGDVQSVQMALNIVEVCRQTPEIRHWIPSRESAIWADALEHVTTSRQCHSSHERDSKRPRSIVQLGEHVHGPRKIRTHWSRMPGRISRKPMPRLSRMLGSRRGQCVLSLPLRASALNSC
jgi:hypothetical protein